MEKGDTYSMAMLGRMLMMGLGTKQDNETAKNLLTKAANAGDAIAQTSLGLM